MCGFTGFIGEIERPERVLHRMMDKVIHRGPDSAGEFIEGEAALGFSDQNFSEIDNAKALSDELDIQNTHAILDADRCFEQLEHIQYQMDEPHADPSIVPLYFLAELAKKDVTVILSGEGADELFGGYEAYDMTPAMKKYRKLPGFVRTPAARLASKLPEMRGKQFLMHSGLPVEEWFIGQANVFHEKEAKNILKEPFQHGPSIQEVVAPYYDQVKGKDDLTKKTVSGYEPLAGWRYFVESRQDEHGSLA